MKEKPSLKTKKDIQIIYAFNIPSGDFFDALCNREKIITALMKEHKHWCMYHSFDNNKEVLCYETEQQCFDAYDAFHKQFPSIMYIGRGEVYD